MTLGGVGVGALSFGPTSQNSIFFGFAAFYLVVIGVGILIQNRTRFGEALSPAPSPWRRIRWVLLAGLPVVQAMGATLYITTELSPIPLLWIVPPASLLLAWVVAFCRVFKGWKQPFTWVIQVAPVAGAFLLLLVILLESREQNPAGREMALLVGGFIAIISIAVLMPIRFTLIAQPVLGIVILWQMYGEWSFHFVRWAMAAHLGLVAITCRGCQGDAVNDAPGADRMMGFVLCVLTGFFGGIVAYRFLAPIVFPTEPIEYPIAIVSAFLIRLVPSSLSRKRQRTPDAITVLTR